MTISVHKHKIIDEIQLKNGFWVVKNMEKKNDRKVIFTIIKGISEMGIRERGEKERKW